MKLLKALIRKFYLYYGNIYETIVSITALFIINIFSIYLIINTILNNKIIYQRDTFTERFIVGPFLILLCCLPLYIFCFKNKNYFVIVNDKNNKEDNLYFWVYLIGSLILLLFSILSGFF